MTLPVMTAAQSRLMMPPAYVTVPVFPSITLSRMIGAEDSTKMAPPVSWAVFPVKTQPLIRGAPLQPQNPPPERESEAFESKRQRSTTGLPSLAQIPPPS